MDLIGYFKASDIASDGSDDVPLMLATDQVNQWPLPGAGLRKTYQAVSKPRAVTFRCALALPRPFSSVLVEVLACMVQLLAPPFKL